MDVVVTMDTSSWKVSLGPLTATGTIEPSVFKGSQVGNFRVLQVLHVRIQVCVPLEYRSVPNSPCSSGATDLDRRIAWPTPVADVSFRYTLVQWNLGSFKA